MMIVGAYYQTIVLGDSQHVSETILLKNLYHGNDLHLVKEYKRAEGGERIVVDG